MKSLTLEVARSAQRVTLLLAAVWSLDATAQMPQAPPQPLPLIPAVPQTMPLPATLAGQPAIFDPNDPGASPRFLFAGALAMVAKSVGATVVSSLSQGIVNWLTAAPVTKPRPTHGWRHLR